MTLENYLDRVPQGEVLDYLRQLPDDTVDCVVSSPPYYGLRSYETAHWDGGDPACDHVASDRYYTEKTAAKSSSEAFSEPGKDNIKRVKDGRWRESGHCTKCGAVRIDDQIGLEQTPQEYIAKIVAVFEEVRRVLKPTGVVFLNVGDTYAGSWGNYAPTGQGGQRAKETERYERQAYSDKANWRPPTSYNMPGFKPKDRMLIPARIAIALQDAGWWIRSEIVWFKSNCMPSSADDRPTDSHEMVYMLTKRARYWSDFTAIREPTRDWGTRKRDNGKWDGEEAMQAFGRPTNPHNGPKGIPKQDALGKRQYTGFNERWDNREEPLVTRNVRSVWQIAPEPSNYQYCGNCNSLFKGNGRKSCPVCRQEKTWIDHYAAFPQKLVERCILAGCPAQVCSSCGKPYERVVEVEYEPLGSNPKSGNKVQATHPRTIEDIELGRNTVSLYQPQNMKYGRARKLVSTTGWRPTCKCDAPVSAGIVLDPFVGSGTTPLVARRLGRHFLGVDLSEAYVKLCNARLAQAYTLPLFTDV